MKKIISLLVVAVMLLSAFAASAKVPEFMMDAYTNYTADYKTSVKLEGAQELKALIEETDFPEEVSNYVDIGSIIESLVNVESRINVQCDVSADFKQIDIAVTTDSDQKFVPNKNFTANVNYKSGLWLHLDLVAETPEFEVVYYTPVHDKYQYANIMDYLDEEQTAQFVKGFEEIFNPEYIQFLTQEGVSLLDRYADIRQSGNRCSVTITNDNLINMINAYVSDLLEVAPSKDYAVAEEFLEEIEEIKIPEGIKILGNKGINIVYELNPRKEISKCTTAVDVDINIADLYTKITGEEWEYTNEGKVGLDVKVDMDLSRIGKTKPRLPVLTEENSSECEFIEDMLYSLNYEDDYSYVNSYIYRYSEDEVKEDGVVYFPMVELLEESYVNSLDAERSGNTITVTSLYFEDAEYVTVSVGSDIAITDKQEYNIGEVKEIDGKVYVTEKFFTDVFGWVLESYRLDFIENKVSYSFANETEYEYFEEDYFEDTQYPYSYVWISYDGFVSENGINYIPLRTAIESAYNDTAEISYKDGKITIECEHFDGFKKMKLTIGKTTAELDGKARNIDKVIAVDGATYVSENFFKDIFGWEVTAFGYDTVNDWTELEFRTGAEE